LRDKKKLRRIAVKVPLGNFPISFLRKYISQLILSCFPSSFHGSNDREYMALAINPEGFINVLQLEFIAKCKFPYPHDFY